MRLCPTVECEASGGPPCQVCPNLTEDLKASGDRNVGQPSGEDGGVPVQTLPDSARRKPAMCGACSGTGKIVKPGTQHKLIHCDPCKGEGIR